MRDPIEDVKRELRAMGATYLGGGTKWLLPNGESFNFERKTGNPRKDAAIAHRRLKEAMEPETVRLARETIQPETQVPPIEPPVVEVPVADVIATAPVDTPAGLMQERLLAGRSQLEAYKLKLETELNRVNRRLEMLKAVEGYADDPMFVETIRAVLPKEKAAPEPVAPGKPIAQYVRIEVTRDIVSTAISMFELNKDFGLDQIMDLLVASQKVDAPELKRIRASVNGALVQLIERGEIIKTISGIGKKPAFFQRVATPRKTNSHHAAAEAVI